MKVVKLSVTQDSKGYTVVTGNGMVFSFSSKKKAAAFAVEASKFFTDKVYQLNFMLSEIYSEYRNIWGYFWHDKKSMGFDVYQAERKVKELLNSCEIQLDKACKGYDFENYPYYMFASVRQSIGYLMGVNMYVKQVHEKHANRMSAKHCALRTKNLMEIKNEVLGWRVDDASQYFEPRTLELDEVNELKKLQIC